MVRRWLTFNGIGLMGLAVQLATLALLIHVLHWHYLAATVAAVEAAVLHNFIWHQRVTWRDRPGRNRAMMVERLVRFHALNGVVSLTGNVLLMAALTGALGIPPVAANLVAVLACSVLNFCMSETLVFRTAAVLLVILISPGASRTLTAEQGADLQSQTLAAWAKYEAAVDARYRQAGPSGPFFVHDAFAQDPGWRRSATTGGIAMFQPERATPGGSEIEVPDGRVHHWVGAVFVPGATVRGVISTLQENAGREADAYSDVIASQVIARDGDRLRVFMKLKRDAPLITVTYNTEHDVEFRTAGAGRAASRSTATRIAELANAGTPQEREKAEGRDSGFLWRLNAYWRYEDVPGGVLIECESLSLSRDIPLLVRPLLAGTVTRIARESLETTLRTLRGVLVSQRAASGAAR